MEIEERRGMKPFLNIVLVEPEIPPNTGNIARLCAATRTRLHLVEPLGFELNDRTLKRAGMDYWEQVEWQSWKSLEVLRAENHEARFWFCTTKTKRLYTEVRYQAEDWLVFGRETRGLPEALLESVPDQCITIPMANPEVRSLNLATSAAIVLYEAIRQIG